MRGPSCSVGLAHSPPSWQLSLAAPPLARVGAESQRTLIPAACAKDFDAETDPRVPASRSTQTRARQMNSRQGAVAGVADPGWKTGSHVGKSALDTKLGSGTASQRKKRLEGVERAQQNGDTGGTALGPSGHR